MFIWLKINGMNDVYDFIMNECSQEGVIILPGHAFYPDSTKQCSYVRICYSQAKSEDVEKVLKNISEKTIEAL